LLACFAIYIGRNEDSIFSVAIIIVSKALGEWIAVDF
jgi:hypothetical protein